jgi:integrase
MAARAGGAKEWGQLAGGGGLSVQGSSTRPASGPQLRLIWSEDDLCGPPQFDDPRKAWTLAEFFERWFLPGKLKPKHRAQGTINLYRDAIRYWEMITGDPPLGLIGDEHGIEFVGQLPECGYTRAGGRRGGHQRIGLRDGSPALMPLSSTTIAQHVSRVAGLLQAAGPRYHIRKASAEILGRCPFVPEYAGQFEAKEPWSLGEVRQITRGCSSMVRPELPAWLPHELWWQTRLALFYFTGMRAGTICALARAHIHDSAGELWLKVPKELVSKTRKAIALPLHPQLAALLRQVETLRLQAGDAGELLLPAGCGYRRFLDLHVALQAAAGLPAEQQQSPHGWRRTHIAQMDRLGQREGEEAARQAGQHAHARTTVEHYIGQAVLNELRLRLPPLFE